MGTRNLTMVMQDGKYKVAQYGQWDGYPSGQGATVVNFLRNRVIKRNDLMHLRSQVEKTRSLTEEEVQARWKSVGANDSGMVGMDVAERFKKDHAHLSRDFGAKILDYVLDTENPEVFLSIDFVGDSLFCEWAYVIDLDKNVLEVYKGFNKKPLSKGDRFYGFNKETSEGYHPISLLKTYPLNKLPTVKKLVKDCSDKDEE